MSNCLNFSSIIRLKHIIIHHQKLKNLKYWIDSFLGRSPDQLWSCYKSLAILFTILVCLERFMCSNPILLTVRIFKWPVIQYIRLASPRISFLSSRKQITMLFFPTLSLRRNLYKLRLIFNKIFHTHLLLAVIRVDSIQFFS